jgi:hypothetical protein
LKLNIQRIRFETVILCATTIFNCLQMFRMRDSLAFAAICRQTENQKESLSQGCQMVYFQTKNLNLGKFWRALERKMLLNYMTIWIFFGHLVYFMAIWYSLYSFGIFFPFWYVWTKKNLATLDFVHGHLWKCPLFRRHLYSQLLCWLKGDKIGRIFARWKSV